MASYSVNKVFLIGNLTRDPELRYTSQGTAVCSFGIATNRSWTTQEGEARDEADFHNIVSWRKLAEICSQLLSKGRKVYVSGRLQTRDWTGEDGVKRYRTEVVIDEMIALDSPPASVKTQSSATPQAKASADESQDKKSKQEKPKKEEEKKVKKQEKQEETQKKTQKQEVNPDDIPF